MGYEGLVSYGGIFGLIIFFWFYCCKMKMNYMDVVDMIVVVIFIMVCFICFVNLMNFEIIGKVIDVFWVFVFEWVDM